MHILNQEELQDIVKWLHGDKLSDKGKLKYQKQRRTIRPCWR